MKSLDPSLRETCEELLRKESSVEPFFRSLFVDVPSAQPPLPSMTTAVPTTVQAAVPTPATMPEETKTIARPPSPPKAVEEEDDFFSCVCCQYVLVHPSITCFAIHQSCFKQTHHFFPFNFHSTTSLMQSATYCTRSLVRPASEMRPVRSM